MVVFVGEKSRIGIPPSLTDVILTEYLPRVPARCDGLRCYRQRVPARCGAYEGEPNMFVYSSWPSYESASIPPS